MQKWHGDGKIVQDFLGAFLTFSNTSRVNKQIQLFFKKSNHTINIVTCRTSNGETIETSLPASVFAKVDFPAFGRPRIDILATYSSSSFVFGKIPQREVFFSGMEKLMHSITFFRRDEKRFFLRNTKGIELRHYLRGRWFFCFCGDEKHGNMFWFLLSEAYQQSSILQRSFLFDNRYKNK